MRIATERCGRKPHVLILFFFFCCSSSFGQLANFGSIIFTDTASIVKVESDFINDSLGLVTHNGLLDIDENFINNKGEVKGNGKYKVTENWINSAVFTPDTSHVYLRGSAQQITGSVSTNFYNLTLLGSGVKSQTLNSYVLHRINLNNLEFSTGKDSLFVLNNSAYAITSDTTFNAEGFISSLTNGCVSWNTTLAQNYFFPVGNRLPVYRFRPVTIAANNSTPYYVSFINHDPTIDARPVTMKDTLACVVNDQFYHMINRDQNTDTCEVAIHYLPTDGNWKTNSQWNDLWKTLPSKSALYSNFKTMSSRVLTFNKEYIALSTDAPSTPPVSTPDVCSGDEITYTFPLSNSNYHWTVTKGSVVDSSINSITVKWDSIGNVTGQIKLSFNNGSCESLPGYSAVSIKQTPLALFTNDTTEILIGTLTRFYNNSKSGNRYTWEFGDGNTSSEINPVHSYEASGSFPVNLTVNATNGCSSIFTKSVTVSGEIKIPDVFTPNLDGTNELFSFLGSSKYDLQIYNRWGLLIYNGDETTGKWDGTSNGILCVDGTYYYVLKMRDRQNKVFNGYISVIR